ncbi:C39 family peptidase [Faecalicatena contorta]|uniref:C39 family peptidase n=1 Tax=Faecalicatena contorta TaxID=39482 RepID=UPI001F3ED4E8|nr:C39 family peptidase [Faecalicatena contorta]MCF2681922.1 C39 family peptidase [Faecalicatena contorta]
MEPKKKESFSKRRRKQQLYQRLVICGTVVLLLGIVGSGSSLSQIGKGTENAVRTAKDADSQKGETAKYEGESIEEKQNESQSKEETQEEKVERVREQAEQAQYPAGVIELLDKNPETVGFVEDYEEKKDMPCAESIGELPQDGSIPLLLQWDERWGYAPYGTSIVAVSGCGPTCMAMVASGLNQDPSITPDKVAAYGTQNGYVDEENNTYWAFMKEAGATWNLNCYEGNLNEKQVSAELTAGHPIICSVGPGDFTKIGHFIVLTGYENGSVAVNDPFSQTNSDKMWVFADIKEQIKAMWIYSKP